MGLMQELERFIDQHIVHIGYEPEATYRARRELPNRILAEQSRYDSMFAHPNGDINLDLVADSLQKNRHAIKEARIYAASPRRRTVVLRIFSNHFAPQTPS